MKRLPFVGLLLLLACCTQSQTTPEVKNVAFYLQKGVEILDFAGPMEVFLQAGLHVYTVAKDKEPIHAMGTLTIVPDYTIENAPPADLVAFFGGGTATSESKDPAVLHWVKEQTTQADLRFSVCTGAFFLGEAGLLDGNTATTFRAAIPGLQVAFPKANVRDDVRFVDNGTVITTGGISAGIDGALHVVAKVKGMETALAVAKNMEYFGWQPEKGLVIESPFLKNIREKGMDAALKAADKHTVFYRGELLDLALAQMAENENKAAMAIFDHAINNFKLSAAECVSIGKCFKAVGRKAPATQSDFMAMTEKGDWNKAAQMILSAQKESPNWTVVDEEHLNMMGYHALGSMDYKKAIELFKLNVVAYPESFNVYDSLGEAYMMAGERDLAIQHYERSLLLNPKNENGKRMLEKMRSEKTSVRRSK